MNKRYPCLRGPRLLLLCLLLLGLNACGRQEETPPPADRREEDSRVTAPMPEGPEHLVVKGFELGMTLKEACELINTRHAEAFPPPVIAFDECSSRKALEGARQLPSRYRNPYLSGNAPWTHFPVQPVKIETLDPYWLATAERLVVREGVQRHVLHYDQCFVADGTLYSSRYKPRFTPNGERELNDNAGAAFETDENGAIRRIYLAAPVVEQLFKAAALTGAQLADKVAAHSSIPSMEQTREKNPSGYEQNIWFYETSTGERLTVFDNNDLLLKSLPF